MLDFQEWTAIHLLTDGGRINVLILHAPNRTDKPNEPTMAYTELNVLAGAGRATIARLAGIPHRITHADTDTVAAVASGQNAGTWQLLLAEDALLRTYQSVDPHQLHVAEGAPADYAMEEPDAYSAEERKLVELHRRLDPKSRVRWKEVGDAFAAADHAAGKTEDNQD